YTLRVTGTDTTCPTLTPIPTLTPTNTYTPSLTPTATATCPPVIRQIGEVGKGNPGKPISIRKPTNMHDLLVASGQPGSRSLARPALPDAPISLVLDDGTREASVGFGSGNTESSALWLNRFTPPPSAYPLTLQ